MNIKSNINKILFFSTIYIISNTINILLYFTEQIYILLDITNNKIIKKQQILGHKMQINSSVQIENDCSVQVNCKQSCK